MPIDRPGVTFIHERGVRDGSSPAENYTPNNSAVTAKFFVPFDQRNDAVVAFLGYSRLVYSFAEPVGIERLTPLRHPEAEFMVATAVPNITHHKWLQGTNDAAGARRNVFKKSELTVQYEFVPYAVKEDAAVTYEWERYTYVKSVTPGVDYLKAPMGMLEYVDADGTPFGSIPFGTGIVVPITEIEVVWVDLPYDLYSLPAPTPWQKRIWGEGSPTTRPWLGTVNKTPMWGLPPGQVLFSNVGLELKKSPTTGLCWDVTFKFSVHTSPLGWNSAYHFQTTADYTPPEPQPRASGWYYVSAEQPRAYRAPGSVPDGASIYCERDLIGSTTAGLFHVGS